MYKRTTVINFLGCPGSGKSTSAAEEYVRLKKEGHSAYLVTEFATDCILAGKQEVLKNQKVLFYNQLKRIQLAMNKVEYIIVDSPLLLNIVYARYNGVSDKKFEKEVLTAIKGMNNEYKYLSPRINYSNLNRVHTEEQAREIDKLIRDVLKENGMVFCQECQRLRTNPVKYGNLVLDMCKSCQNRRLERQRE